nr:zinc transporter ZntB [Legionellales bacterium]
KLSWQAIRDWQPKQGVLWVHLDFTEHNSQRWLSEDANIPSLIAQALLADESRPRTTVYKEGFLTTMRGLNLNPGADPQDMVSIRMWCEQHRVITTRRRHLLSIDDLQQDIANGRSPQTSHQVVIRIAECLAQRMSNPIEEVDDQLDALSEQIIDAQSYQMRSQLADLRRQVVSLRRYLAPQREALSELYLNERTELNSMDRMRIREISERITYYVEELDSARDRASVTQEELMGRLAEKMEQRMYLLSIVAVIFLPLSFVTGLLGINVDGIPFANLPTAFAMVCIGLVGLGLIEWWLFRKLKWI